MKVGIITHYYKSENYGGNLQAYALCRAIKGLGYDVEQISFDRTKGNSLKTTIKAFIKKVLNTELKNRSNFNKRRKAILSFNNGLIPHSSVYNVKTIKKCADKYDAFVTGSDQVWHPRAVCDAYLLKFAPSNKIKLSYAASVACNEIPEAQRARYKNALSDFTAISVREKEAIKALDGIAPNDIEVTLDPTLLLTKEQWQEIAEPSNINEDYLFCYFLGDDQNERTLAEEYAKKNSLEIVTLPHLLGTVRKCDKDFGDYKLYDVTPQRLISLINDAKCIFTDSFHATVFSLIFKKEHFIFQRSGHKSMSSRIYTLCNLFETQEHFCDTEEKAALSYIESVDRIDYTKEQEAYLKQRENSLAFLKSHLNRR